MNEVSSLVLSTGEKTTKEAIKRLKAQTHPVKRIILIKNISPWARAFRTGLSKVRTEFFINCNADMLLYPNCVERLLSYMKKDVGLAIGRLKDPLYGTILSIKLYRAESLKTVNFNEKSPTPDTDLIEEMEKAGWRKIYANKHNFSDSSNAEVLGLHCPEYTPIYTYKKFKTLGIRIAKRGVLKGLHRYLGPLKENHHPMAKIALVALSLGLFSTCRKNALEVSDVKEEFTSIKGLLNKIKLKNNLKDGPINLSLLKKGNSPELLFKKFFSIGKELRFNLALDKFNNLLSGLLRAKNKHSCFGAIGLCYGFFHNFRSLKIDIDKEWLKISQLR